MDKYINVFYQLLDDFRGKIPEDELRNVYEYIEHNENGVALDLFVDLIIEFNCVVEKTPYENLILIGNQMRIDVESILNKFGKPDI